VRGRLIATVALATALSIALFGIPLSIVVGRLYRDRQVISLEREVAEASLHVPPVPVNGSGRLPSIGPGGTLAFYDSAGRLVLGRGPAVADALTWRAIHGDVVSGGHQHDEMVLAGPVVRRGRVVGGFRAAELDGAVDHAQHRAWALMTLAGVFAGVVAAVLTLFQARRVVAPIRDLAAVAHRLAEGDLTARAAVTGVSEVDEAAAAMNAGTDRIVALLERERTLSADASHQLRTPLTALRVRLEAALDRPDADLAVAIHAAIGETERLERTIDELLALARDDPSARKPLDRRRLVRELEERWQGELTHLGRRLVVVEEPGVSSVRSSHGAMTHALDVLVANAVRHGEGTVTVRVRSAAGALAIEVEDEGAGVVGSPEDAFRRRNGQPHGIGLALARSLVEAEGGRLVLTRRAPRPVFTVILPAG